MVSNDTPDIYLAAGDTQPALALSLTDASGSPVDLTGASVTLRLVSRATGLTVLAAGACAIVGSANSGNISYQWQAADTAAPGDYLADVRVTVGGAIETYPNDDSLLVRIKP